MNFSDVPKFKHKRYRRPPELGLAEPVMPKPEWGAKHVAGQAAGNLAYPFVIIGSGPIGLALALDLALKGQPVTLLTAFDFIARGSKAICFAKQSLDILDRLGVGEQVVDKGVIWNVGKLFWQDRPEPLYQFDMLPVKDQKNPGFVNIQQYHVEDFLLNALENMDNVDIRWGNMVTDIAISDGAATLQISTPDGDYALQTQYVLACDGHKSLIREKMGLSFEGRMFEDNFLIADIKFSGKDADARPSERWFWFDPPFCKGGTSLLHKQPDNVWRLDFQLGWDIDRAEAIKPENVAPLVRGMLGDDVEFKEEWYSVYTFQCRRMERFVHGPVIFVGDSAHLVSPFGARGANGGLSDAENIAWKLDLVLRGEAGPALIESYNAERVMGADENILNSSRSTDFMTPKSRQSMAFRDAVLELSHDYAFARPFINSGRLSTPTPYHDSMLSTPDCTPWDSGPAPGHPCVDAPLNDSDETSVRADHANHVNDQDHDNPLAAQPIKWLLPLLGNQFTILHFGDDPPLGDLPSGATCNLVHLPCHGLAAHRYGAAAGATYLVRPDQVVAGRWKTADPHLIDQAYARATGHHPALAAVA